MVLIDFGFALEGKDQRREIRGSYGTVAPEVLLGMGRSKLIDFFSVGWALQFSYLGGRHTNKITNPLNPKNSVNLINHTNQTYEEWKILTDPKNLSHVTNVPTYVPN